MPPGDHTLVAWHERIGERRDASPFAPAPTTRRHLHAAGAGARASDARRGWCTRALLASFLTVALVLGAVFAVLSLDVREQRAAVGGRQPGVGAAGVHAGRGAPAAGHARDGRDAGGEPDTQGRARYLADRARRGAATDATDELLATVQREANKIADRVSADVLAVADRPGRDHRQRRTAGGVVAARRRRLAAPRDDQLDDRSRGRRSASGVYRVVSVPLQLGDAAIGSLELGTALDAHYARELADLSRGQAAILEDGVVLASTLERPAAARSRGLPARRRPRRRRS